MLERFFPIHLIHVYDGTTGRVVAVSRMADLDCADDGDPQTTPSKVYLWTPPPTGSPAGFPGTFQFIPVPDCRTDLFCGGHSALADGRVLYIGGTRLGPNGLGEPEVNIFDPTAPVGSPWNTARTPHDMAFGRYYATATTLPSGHVMAFSGEDEEGLLVGTPEVYDADHDAWTQVPTAERVQPYYPFMFVLPNGHMVDAGPGESRMLNTATWTWGAQPLANPSSPVPPGDHGSAVMYEPGKILKCGGREPGVTSTYVVDLSNANPNNPPAWMAAGPMQMARRNHNLVVLPDGRVLAVGGNLRGFSADIPSGAGPEEPVFEAEIFDPATGNWTLQTPSDSTQPRWYHSVAMLLPDGRVLSAGGQLRGRPGSSSTRRTSPPACRGTSSSVRRHTCSTIRRTRSVSRTWAGRTRHVRA